MQQTEKEVIIKGLQDKYNTFGFCLDERSRRLWAATEAKTLGRGGIALVHKAIGMARSTILAGIKQITQQDYKKQPGIRKPGGGRKQRLDNKDLVKDLEGLLEPTVRGEPTSCLKWTTKSVRKLAEALEKKGHKISFTTLPAMLKKLGYSLQANRKTQEGANHPDRDAQFQYIEQTTKKALQTGNPCISVDAKKKKT